MAGPATPPPSPNAFLLRRRLRRELAAARQAAGLTQAQAAEALGVSLSTVVRAELGETGISPKDIVAYSQIYKVAERLDELIRMAREASRLPWRGYRDIVDREALEFFGYEASAAALRIYQVSVVPGLLQTEDYAASLLSSVANLTPETIRRHVELRRERREHSFSGATRHTFILDESVLSRRVGSPKVMAGQLKRLESLVADGLPIHILPFSAGANYAVAGSFVLSEFEDGDHVLYIEYSPGGRIFKDLPSVVGPYRVLFEQMIGASLDREETRAALQKAMGTLRPIAP